MLLSDALKGHEGLYNQTKDAGVGDGREVGEYKKFRIYKEEDLYVGRRNDGESVNGYSIEGVKKEIDKITKDAGSTEFYKGYLITHASPSSPYYIEAAGRILSEEYTIIDAKKKIDKWLGHSKDAGVGDILFVVGENPDDKDSRFDDYNKAMAHAKVQAKKLNKKMIVRQSGAYNGMLVWAGGVNPDGTTDAAPADVAIDPIQEALINLFSSKGIIKDHKDLHALAESMGVEPSDMEERAYAMLQSFFSQGRYIKEGQDKNFDPDELKMGDVVELEHTSEPVIARRIALDHLSELSDYYTRLKKMEQAGNK